MSQQRGFNTYQDIDEFVRLTSSHLLEILLRRLALPVEPRELALSYIDGDQVTEINVPQLLAFAADRKAEPHLRELVLDKLQSDARLEHHPVELSEALSTILNDSPAVAVPATYVAGHLIRVGLVEPSMLRVSAQNSSWKVREAAINVAVKNDDIVTLDVLEDVAGRLSYHVPVQKAVKHIVLKARQGRSAYVERRKTIIESYLSNDSLSDTTRSKLRRALQDDWPET
jgi:hypothetical protein